MIIKDRTPPVPLEALPRLQHRLPTAHAAQTAIPEQLYQTKAGFGGESYVDDVLRQVRLYRQPVIVRDLYFLTIAPCQIDTLLLFPHFAVVLEIKNYTGILHFSDEGRRMEREKHKTGERQGFDSPIVQLQIEMEELSHVFRELAIPLPVIGAVVLPHTKTLMRGDTGGVPVIYAKALGRWIAGLPRGKEWLQAGDVPKAGAALLQRQLRDKVIDFQKRIGYSAADVLAGVRCSGCGRVAVRVSERMHHCTACDVAFSDGFKRALDDWFDFKQPVISVRECQVYLGLKDRFAASYLLRKMGYIAEGNTSKRVYRRK
ncbi:nuclease-related domain-containing protein [Planococcus lenghuensis]|uniref:NERD domain-containing protein n=1 Tax=Planococcus lenghuensis TaxID=2213202 RepID=A0A1Q2L2F3_9BACL|nr:nuclease-related domain-containing protein [Planococcus lenghuensis]AQQ54237.1 hypothetical protein B0X71_14780 [Planococcus lenghuensis]